MACKEILIAANSPGEIIGWTMPVVKAIRERNPNSKIFVMLLPCSFSSGREKEAAERIGSIDKVFTVKETLALILKGNNSNIETPSVLLHLGGDLFYSALLSQRLNIPAWSFEWAQKKWDRRFKGYFARDEKNRQILLERGIPGDKIHIVGDLLVDSVAYRAKEAESIEKGENMIIALMPGSRLREAKGLIPLFCGVAELIRKRFPNILFYIPVSPFIDRKEFLALFPLCPDEKFGGVRVAYEKNQIITDGGVVIHISYNSLGVIKNSDFIITIPGTTTGEAGALGVPCLSILPLNRPEYIPYVGLIGLLEHVPLVGKPLKAGIMMRLSRDRLLSQPNLRAGKELIPEIIDIVSPESIFQRILPFLESPEKRKKIRDALISLYSTYSGAATKIAETLCR